MNSTAQSEESSLEVIRPDNLRSSLTPWLSFKSAGLRRRYERITINETPLRIVLTIILVYTACWMAVSIKFRDETPLWLTLADIGPLFLRFVYCYAVWIFQTKRVVCRSPFVALFNRMAVEHIASIGSAIILLNIVSCEAAALKNSGFNETYTTALDYRNFAALFLDPVLFSLHSFPVSLVVILAALLCPLSVSSPVPPSAQYLVPIALVLYTINFSNKKKFLLHIELEDVRCALLEAEKKSQCVEVEIIDMRHMIGSMTHDLKTPLQAFLFEIESMKNECQHLSSPLDGIEIAAFKHAVEDNVSQLKVIVSFMTMAINRSLDYTKVSSGLDLLPSISPLNIPETLAWITSTLTHKVRKSVTITTEPLTSSISATILTDRQWFIENLFCLLSNAQKFTSEGEILVRCVLLQGQGAIGATPMLMVEVEDSGIGLSDAQKRVLFQPFKQAQKRAGGTGLGLFSLHKRIGYLGGDCGVKDRPDNRIGSIFWFSFPYAPNAVDVLSDTCTTLSDGLEVCSQSCVDSSPNTLVVPSSDPNVTRRILVVDDSILIQKTTKRLLERDGHVVDVASNGYECLKMINTAERRYDLILLDLNMPVMDGFETIKRLRAQESRGEVGCGQKSVMEVCAGEEKRSCGLSSGIELGACNSKTTIGSIDEDERGGAHVVVGFSGNCDPVTQSEALAAGMDSFLAKPLSPQDLRNISSFMRE